MREGALFHLQEAASAIGAKLKGASNPIVMGVGIDSRLIKPGELFVALQGEHTDGHLHVAEAFARGASAAMVCRRVEAEGPLLEVDDCLRGLSDLAKWHRSRVNPMVIGVTGSVGKTTVKEMIASIAATRFRTLKSEGNFNTEIGLPLTLLRLKPATEVAVVEMAMRGLGQIQKLCEIARPSIGVITSIGETHLELLGSVENIARAKWELVESLPADGWAILNWDEPWPRRLAPSARCRLVRFGFSPEADVTARDVRDRGEEGMSYTLVTVKGEINVNLPVNGKHMVCNSLAGAAFGLIVGLELEEIRFGLEHFSSSKMRLELLRIGDVLVINDAYNANPSSMKAALEVLKSMAKGRCIAVLGDMLELGTRAVEGHREVGQKCAEVGIDILVGVGPLSKNITEAAITSGVGASRVYWCKDRAEASQLLSSLVKPGDTVLVKGSRGSKMEEVIVGLKG
ncbi:MAG TPA: UDP-N-acetylmuramoyl-tripeptide--D-alanyl-D-alanine ligase [Firmicutes bacterium]|nr:UDP-N-acetylmuramoyl-tripeptide--D-alanyl-D-alanine ligase [Bacillota bacterium]